MVSMSNLAFYGQIALLETVPSLKTFGIEVLVVFLPFNASLGFCTFILHHSFCTLSSFLHSLLSSHAFDSLFRFLQSLYNTKISRFILNSGVESHM